MKRCPKCARGLVDGQCPMCALIEEYHALSPDALVTERLRLLQVQEDARVRVDAIQRLEIRREREAHKAAIKAVGRRRAVWLRRQHPDGPLKLGEALVTERFGAQYLICSARGARWSIPYDDLQTAPLTEDELRVGKINLQLNEALAEVMDKEVNYGT